MQSWPNFLGPIWTRFHRFLGQESQLLCPRCEQLKDLKLQEKFQRCYKIIIPIYDIQRQASIIQQMWHLIKWSNNLLWFRHPSDNSEACPLQEFDIEANDRNVINVVIDENKFRPIVAKLFLKNLISTPQRNLHSASTMAGLDCVSVFLASDWIKNGYVLLF